MKVTKGKSANELYNVATPTGQQGIPGQQNQQGQQAQQGPQGQNMYVPQSQPVKQGAPKWLVAVLCIGLVVSLAGNGVLAWRIFSGPGYSFSFSTGLIGGPDVIQTGTLAEEEPEKLEQRLQEKDEPYKVSYIFNTKPYFPSGDLPGSISVENPPESMYDMRFTIYLEDWTHVYTSPKLKPCQYIVSGKLNKNLDKGLYKANAYFSFYDCETGTYMGRKSTPIILNIAS